MPASSAEPAAVPPGHHGLQHEYSFWYRLSGQKPATGSYEDSIKPLGNFKTAEGFWDLYGHMVRPNDVTGRADHHLFKRGIKPVWEDDNNAKGGKFVVKLKKGMATHYWELLLLGIIGEQFDNGHAICGAVLSTRFHEDSIALWNRDADDVEGNAKIKDTMVRILELPTWLPVEYRRHSSKTWSKAEKKEDDAAGDASDGATPHASPPGPTGWAGPKERQQGSSWRPRRNHTGTAPATDKAGGWRGGHSRWNDHDADAGDSRDAAPAPAAAAPTRSGGWSRRSERSGSGDAAEATTRTGGARSWHRSRGGDDKDLDFATWRNAERTTRAAAAPAPAAAPPARRDEPAGEWETVKR